MAVDRVARRIAAILAADVVGYSQLVGRDEESTLAVLKDYRALIDGLIARYEGRIFGSAGDSVIAEFASPVEAVRCATEIQLELDRCNAALPEARRMRFRIGINLGDVVVDGDNLMGDGVNVAARLEALAAPGGICVSEAIHAQVRDRLSLDFLDLGEHRLKNIARPVRAFRVPLASEEQVKSPFRGLEAFEFGDASIFFGRTRAIASCVERLEQLAGGGRAFLLIYGMSGSGKSSLLRAGLLPRLIRPGETEGIALWRRCLIRPSEGADAIAALATGLLQEGALPELAEKRTAAELSDALRAAPDRAPALIRGALARVADKSGVAPSQVRLVVAIDQMEELFTTQAPGEAREVFVRLLAALAASGVVWVIGTIRADFFHRCGEIPGFSALKDGLASYELLPPTGPEIAQIIREPARAAGLRFEETAEQGRLEDVLQEAAAADPASLPLLEFVLNALYETCREQRMLTFAAYRALGGLEGAIARRADEIVDALPTEVQDALPWVLRSLTTVRPGDEAVTTCPAEFGELAGTLARSALVDALVGARLLISDEDVEGRAIVRVAHEALLTRWPRARSIVSANRAFLETRARLQADAGRWRRENKNPELLLPAGKRLAEGEELLGQRREEVDEHIADYIEASVSGERARQERERQAELQRIQDAETAKRERLELEARAATNLARRTRIAAAVALLLAIGAGVGAIAGWLGQREAVTQAALAEANAKQADSAKANALAAKDEALRSQSLALSFLSEDLAERGSTEEAVLLALEALPKNTQKPNRPYVVDAETALYRALLGLRQTTVLPHEAGVTHAAFSPDGSRIATASFDGKARIWDAALGTKLATFSGHTNAIERVAFSPNGKLLATAGRDGTARVWDANSGKQLFAFDQRGDGPTAIFSPDGTRVLTAASASLKVWDSATGRKIAEVRNAGTSRAAFSPDGTTFAAAQTPFRIVRVWRTEDGTLVKSFDVRTYPNKVAFSADGRRLLASSATSQLYGNEASRLIDVTTGSQIAALGGHRSDTYGGIFSDDGLLVATLSMDGTARLWDGVTGAFKRELGVETAGITFGDVIVSNSFDQELDGAFSPDGRLLATASTDSTAFIWDVQTGRQVAVLRGHSKFVEHVEFSPDGTRLLTASHDGTVRLWDIDGLLTTRLHHQHPPTFAAFSSDGRRIVTLGNDNIVRVVDASTKSEIATLGEERGASLQYAVFTPDGQRLAAGAGNGKITLWDIAGKQQIGRFELEGLGISSLAFDQTGGLLLATSVDGTTRLWNVTTGAEVSTLQKGSIRNARFSPNGKLILTGSENGDARLTRIDGSVFRTITAPGKRISVANFSADGRMLVTGCSDGSAQVWSTDDGSMVKSLEGKGGALKNIEFSRDARRVIAASRDGTVAIWRMEDGARQILRGHTGEVGTAEFSPSGLYAVTASSTDRTVKLWAVDSGREIAVLSGNDGKISGRAKGPAQTYAAFSPDGREIVALSGDDEVRLIRAFDTPQELIDYARAAVPRELTTCERRRFFLPVEGKVEDCQVD